MKAGEGQVVDERELKKKGKETAEADSDCYLHFHAAASAVAEKGKKKERSQKCVVALSLCVYSFYSPNSLSLAAVKWATVFPFLSLFPLLCRRGSPCKCSAKCTEH